ncbi:gamma-glutamyltransferase, partial [Raoultella sp. 18093]|uniref:gamma-glutamyltransferase n=1 Tax=Raoultella sp. 18093 TaxID=2681425 RepID=UPI00190F4B4E
LQHAEQILRGTRDAAVQAGKLAVLGQMSAGMGHELNQPLAALQTLSDNAIALDRQGRREDVAENLRLIGELAARMVEHVRSVGGLLTREDLARYAVRRTAPLTGSYRGRTVTTNQPPGGGAMLLQMLNILENFPLAEMEHNGPAYLRLLSEAMKKATSDKDRHIGDPAFVEVPLEQLLSKDGAARVAE